MLVNKVVLMENANVSKRMVNLIGIINDDTKSSDVKPMYWQADMINYVDDTWEKLRLKHQGLFGADNHKKDEEMYYNVSKNDTKYVTLITDMAIASSILYSTEVRKLSYLRNLIPTSDFGKSLWDTTMSNLSIVSDSDFIKNLSELFTMSTPESFESPKKYYVEV